MGGYNLPPGCRVSDIPGNSSEDEAFENFANEMDALFTKYGLREVGEDADAIGLIEAIWEKLEEARTAGYKGGLQVAIKELKGWIGEKQDDP